MLQLRIRILAGSLAAGKIHLLVLGRLQQDFRGGDARVTGGLGDIVASLEVWCPAEGLGVLDAGGGG